MGVVIAGLAGWAARRGAERWTLGTGWAGEAAEWVAFALFAALIFYFWRLVVRRGSDET
jgi:hypothetical protein